MKIGQPSRSGAGSVRECGTGQAAEKVEPSGSGQQSGTVLSNAVCDDTTIELDTKDKQGQDLIFWDSIAQKIINYKKYFTC